MKPAFWLEAWENGRRGFHMEQPNPDLVEYASRFPKGSVLVPLCGASLDLGWLAERGYHAIGVELSPIAVAELVERHGLQPGRDRGGLEVVEGQGITVLMGDFFTLQPEHVGPLSFIWDRAALVALHPSQRQDYVSLQRELMGPETGLLLNVLNYDKSKLDGPPWAVTREDVAALWGDLELLDATSAPAQGRFAEYVDTMERLLYASR